MVNSIGCDIFRNSRNFYINRNFHWNSKAYIIYGVGFCADDFAEPNFREGKFILKISEGIAAFFHRDEFVFELAVLSGFNAISRAIETSRICEFPKFTEGKNLYAEGR